MPDIGYQMQLLNAAQNRPMQDLDTLMNSIGNVYQHGEARNDEQDAIKYFIENEVTPESIRDFSANHPQMPPVDVYKFAGAVATQKKAQKTKNAVKNLRAEMDAGGTLDEKRVMQFIEESGMNPTEGMDYFSKAAQAGLDFKKAKEVPTKTELGGAVDDLMTQINPDTGNNYTRSEAYSFVAHPQKKTEKITIYKGGLEQTVSQEEADKLLKTGWGYVRPIFAPPKPESEAGQITRESNVENRINLKAHREAIAATKLRFGSNSLAISLGAGGIESINSFSNPEAETYYTKIRDTKVSEGIDRAIKLKQLPESYRLPAEQKKTPGYEKTMKDAQEAIKKGAPKEAVRKRLGTMGYTEKQLQSPYFDWLK